jgi:hypothetical protein
VSASGDPGVNNPGDERTNQNAEQGEETGRKRITPCEHHRRVAASLHEFWA